MKKFLFGFLFGIVFTAIIYIVLPLLVVGDMFDFTRKAVYTTFLQHSLLCALFWGVFFCAMDALKRRNKRKEELENAMRDYYLSNTRKENDGKD